MKERVHLFAIIFYTVSLLFFNYLPNALAVPANPEISTVNQPDGSVIKVYIKGDEWTNWVETKGGFTISQDKNTKKWFYVDHYTNSTPVLSTTPADSSPPPFLQQHVIPKKKLTPSPPSQSISIQNYGNTLVQQSVPVPSHGPTGTFSGNILFILASFNNQSGAYSESTWGAFISNNIADFYDKASYGKVSLNPAVETSGNSNNGVIGWVNVGYDHPNTGSSTDSRNQQLTRDAIIQADSYIDYSFYDVNSDGYVDADELAIVVIAAGFERSYSSAYTPNVWGHQWSLWTGSVSAPTVDGVIVGDYHSGAGGYAQFGEIHQSSSSDQHQATMGIMVHELGHLIFNMPDLYDTDGSSSGIGGWCVMSAGSWGSASGDTWAGETPVLPSAWIRYTWDWVTADNTCGVKSITAAGDASATDANSVFMVQTSNSPEYFLVENRRPVGYDSGLEGVVATGLGGLAVWHVNDLQSSNANDSNRWVDLEEADGTQMGTGRGEITDLWYLGNATDFNVSSTPNSNLYSGAASTVAVTSISAAQTTMTADLQSDYCGTVSSNILWDQPYDNLGSGIVSDYYLEEGLGTYAADDFTNGETWQIDTIYVNGFINSYNLDITQDLNWIIYPDSGGDPAGHPGDGSGTEVWSFTAAYSHSAVTIGDDSVTLNVTTAKGSALTLSPGTYWLVFYPSVNTDSYDRWNWYRASTTNGAWAKLYDDGNFGGFSWSDIQTLLGDSSWHDLAFHLEGTTETSEVPTVITQAVTAIGTTTATGNGNITDLGTPNPTQHGVCWNTTGTPTTTDTCSLEGAASATGAFVTSITSLTPNTTYYVRAYATNTAGTSYGGEVSFTTDSSSFPTVTTQDVTDIGSTTAMGNGTIVALGTTDISQHGVCWNSSGIPTTADVCTKEGTALITGTFISAMTDLIPATIYYVRAYATTAEGTAYGDEVVFTTAKRSTLPLLYLPAYIKKR